MKMASLAYLKRLVTQFESAVRLHEMVGAAHPEDRPYIEQDYDAAKQRLLLVLAELQKASRS